jgi:RNA polymerase sigma-70 factor (ECF subfamily)
MLVGRVAGGDKAAMRALYLRHAETVQRFVQSRLRDQVEAADIVHTTMLEVWRTAERFQGRSGVRSWILSIARNKTIDHIRKNARVDVSEPDEAIPDETPNPEAVLAAVQDASRVRACVEKLKDQHRSAVHLAFFQDMSYSEIAEVEGVPEGTIKTRIYHAKKLLMRCLSR